MGTVVLFRGESARNVVSDRVDRDALLLSSKGVDVRTADLTQPLQLPPANEIDLFVGYQGWGHDLRLSDGRSAIEACDAPFIALLGDHPIHHAARVAAFPANTTICVSSLNQIGFLQQHLSSKSNIRHFTSTASVSGEPARERDLGALVVGQVQSPEQFLAAQNLPVVLVDIIRSYVETAAADAAFDPVTSYMETGYARVLDLVGNAPSAIGVGRLIDLAARLQFKWRFSNALRRLPVTFVGDDWVKMPRRADDRFTALPSVSYQDLPGLYARAQIGLNLFPPYYDFHERIVDVIAQGTALATPRTDWLADCFAFDEEVLALPNDPDQAADWLHGLLADGDRLTETGLKGRDRVARDFTDETRIELFMDILNGRTADGPNVPAALSKAG